MLWLKAFHIFAVVAWMAGLFYLPRLFVYHATAKTDSELAGTLKVMEERLLRIIMMPAMAAVWISGLLLAWLQGVFLEGWLLA
jgi:putative membrane protein